MKIVKEVTVTLSPKEVEEIIKNHLKKAKGINVTTIFFDINEHDRGTDNAQYILDNIICDGKIYEQNEEVNPV